MPSESPFFTLIVTGNRACETRLLCVSDFSRVGERERETLVTSIDIKLKPRVIMHNNDLDRASTRRILSQ